MKRLMISIVTACMVMGCSGKNTSSISETEEPEVKESVWLAEPEMEFDDVKDFQNVTQKYLHVNTETFGDIYVKAETELKGTSEPAVIVSLKNEQGTYDYDGNLLHEINLNVVQSYSRQGIHSGYVADILIYGITNSATSVSQVFNDTYTETAETDLFTTNPVGYTTSEQFLAVQNGVFGIVAMMSDEDGIKKGWAFEALDPSVLEGRTVVYTVNNVCTKLERVIYDPSSGSITSIASGAEYKEGSFANGYYIISDGTFSSIIYASNATGVAIAYHGAGYMADGYAPVNKNGKWGYVDSSGYEVTDFLFEKATSLNDGKAYVKYNGKYGIIDIAGLLEQGKQINYAELWPTAEEQIGTVTTLVSSLLIRSTPSTGTDNLGTCIAGSQYPVYEISEDDQYTWYRIGENAWIADNGSWCEYIGESE